MIKKRKDKRKAIMKRNPVAKNINKFNKAATHRDRKNDYNRKTKHRKQED